MGLVAQFPEEEEEEEGEGEGEEQDDVAALRSSCLCVAW